MKDYHGIIFAYSADNELRELVSVRNTAALPFCGRYRVIDFALSSLRNAGIFNVGVIMQREYQSLLNHLGSGKPWDMSRRVGGLRILPPFGLPENHSGKYDGTVEALNAVARYIKSVPQNHIILLKGNICANLDLDAAIELHESSDTPITAICAKHASIGLHHRCVLDENGYVKKMLFDRVNDCEGVASLDGYIIHKDLLLKLMDMCKAANLFRFHKDAIATYIREGGKMNAYVHEGYAGTINSVEAYYRISMDMLNADNRRSVFNPMRPVRTKIHEEVSTYYGENAVSRSSLVADNCIIEGEIQNCIVSSGARIAKGAKLRNCIIMSDCTVGEGCELCYVIADKHVSFSENTVLTGAISLPVVVPKNFKI